LRRCWPIEVLNRRVWVSVAIGALLAPVPALARGVDMAVGEATGAAGTVAAATQAVTAAVAADAAAASSMCTTARAAVARVAARAVESIPGFRRPGCHRLAWSTQAKACDNVFNSCGPPTATRQVVYALRESERVVDVWTYESANTVTRTLRFENGMLTSVGSVGPLRR
jgi:hypothetical protein